MNETHLMYGRGAARVSSCLDAAAARSSIAFRRCLSSTPHISLRHITADILKSIPLERTRNLSIIAHVDHGKSTLSDRLMELTLTISSGGRAQYLDKLQVERERGITIKAQTVSMLAERANHDGTRELFLINLIDTPGHVDFSYEVSRSLHACQGVVLVVDASQGVQAQTVANYLAAVSSGVAVVPVVNKIDLPHADVERVRAQLNTLYAIEPSDVIPVSAKSGLGVSKVLDAIIDSLPPPPPPTPGAPFKALLFDMWYDDYKGVICLIAVRDGAVRVGDMVACASSRKSYSVKEVGVMNPEAKATQFLNAGQVGYIIVGMRTTSESKVGDTLFAANHDVVPFPGFKPAKPMVFAGVFPIESGDGFESLQSAINRLTLNDASVSVQKESSVALGMGFRCGFLGLLHMEVFKQRLFTEFGNGAIVTNPTVPYKVTLKSGAEKIVSSPTDFPAHTDVLMQMEPMVNAIVMVPLALVGDVMKLCKERRGTQTKQTLLDPSHVMLEYYIPLAEVVTDFCDDLKSKTSGFASLDYEDAGYREAPLCLLEIMLNGKEVDSLSSVVHRDNADNIGRSICSRLKEVMGRQQFDVAIQASVHGKVIARETVKCFRKNVLVKSGKTVGGGDVTRKQKLLQKQKEGKKMLKRVGNVDISQDAFLAVMRKS